VYRLRDPSANEGDQLDDVFDEVRLADDPYRVVLPTSHRLARRSALRLADLATERFIMPPPDGFLLRYRVLLERLCSEAGFEPNIAHVVNDVTVARALVAAGLGVAVLPELAVQPPHDDVAVRRVRDIEPFRSLHATWLRGRHVPAVAQMVRCLSDAAPSSTR
jgi:DNA-binding transcriptional LysR family regulator